MSKCLKILKIVVRNSAATNWKHFINRRTYIKFLMYECTIKLFCIKEKSTTYECIVHRHFVKFTHE